MVTNEAGDIGLVDILRPRIRGVQVIQFGSFVYSVKDVYEEGEKIDEEKVVLDAQPDIK